MGNQVHSKAIFQFQGKGLENEVRGKPGEDSSSSHVQMKKIEHLSTCIFKILFLLSEAGGEFIKKFLPYSSRRLYHTHHESARLFSNSG